MEANGYNSSLNQTPLTCIMRELLEAINDYIKYRTDRSAKLIEKFLQQYSVTIDVNTFSPDNTYVAQFYVGLYELLNNVEPESSLAWLCVEVLANACRNSSAKQALIESYHFVPVLTRLLETERSVSNKTTLLLLLQDITCGIKLNWQVSYVPKLLKILTKWVEDKHEGIVCLSLGVIVNVCFKNMAVVHILAKIVDIKKFLKYCFLLKGPLIRIHVLKLMVMLGHLDDPMPTKIFLDLINPTFMTVEESLTRNDSVTLRSAVSFFVEMIDTQNIEIFKQYTHYIDHMESLVQLLNSRKPCQDADTTPPTQHDPVCVMLIFKFINALDSNKLADFSPMYGSILSTVLEWTLDKKVSCEAFTLLTTITQNLLGNDNNGDVLNILTSHLPTLLSCVQQDAQPADMESCNRLASVLQLLRMMLKCKHISSHVLNALNESVATNIFSQILTDNFHVSSLPQIKVNNGSTSCSEYVDVYIHAISLIHEAAQHDANWTDMLNTLIENRNIQTLLALGLSGSRSEVKQLILEFVKFSRFPITEVANAMHSSQNMFYTDCSDQLQNSAIEADPFLGFKHEVLDETLTNFKRLMREQKVSNIPINQVIDLYEYKLASLSYSELSTTNSLKAASDRCIYLHNRLVQLSSEHSKFLQLIPDYENRLEESKKTIGGLETAYLEEKKKADVNIEKYSKKISLLEEKLQQTESDLEQMTEAKTQLEEKLNNYQGVINRLEENCKKLEKQLLVREQQLKDKNSHINVLNAEVKDLKKTLEQKELKLIEVNKNMAATEAALDTITKVAQRFRQ